jgi:hypothetical protein
MHVWTDTPDEDTWRWLRYFRSPANAERALRGELGNGCIRCPLTKEAVRQRGSHIAACVQQADEYFHAANAVTLFTKPLLLFYGIHALGKAVVIAAIPERALSQFQYHGLKTRPTDELQRLIRSDEASWTPEQEFCTVDGGLFPDLCHAAKNTPPAAETTLSLFELLRIVPELAGLFEKHYGQTSHSFHFKGGEPKKIEGSEDIVYTVSARGLERFLAIFPELSTCHREERTGYGIQVRVPPSQATVAPMVRSTVMGDFAVRPYQRLYEPVPVLFAVLHIISNLVRYHPHRWARTVEGQYGGAVAILDTACQIAQRRFPREALELMWGEPFTFGAPGYA